jgi:hypothetical protein
MKSYRSTFRLPHLFAILIVSSLLGGSSCVTNPKKESQEVRVDYAAWSEIEIAKDWTRTTEILINNLKLNEETPNDVELFCPNYKTLKKEVKTEFWVGLISAMAKKESNFDPAAFYTENFKDANGEYVVSRGLLQLSIESANQRRYNCNLANASALHNPEANISCAANILATWIKQDKVIAKTDTGNKGGARYWSVLRRNSRSLPTVIKFTNSMQICR